MDLPAPPAGPFAEALQDPTLLLPITEDEPDYDRFKTAMRIAFDATDAVMADIANYDYLWRPPLPGGPTLPNYYTLASADTAEREPVRSILSYLFEKKEPYYGERYDRNPAEKERLEQCRQRLRGRYASPGDYFGAVAKRLYLRDRDLPGELSPSGLKTADALWGAPGMTAAAAAAAPQPSLPQ